jgi:hypothetical protein
MSARIYAASLSALLFAACAGGSPPRVLATPVPGNLVPIGETRVGAVTASGVQIYECRARGDSIGAEWTFVAPEADLYDEQGRPAGKHFAGPSWDAGDGSRIAGTTQASAIAPRPDSIPWLLLNTHSVGGAGRFAAVTSVQRIRTAGGTAPDAGCTTPRIGRTVRVPYAAVYVMYSKETTAATAGATKASPT